MSEIIVKDKPAVNVFEEEDERLPSSTRKPSQILRETTVSQIKWTLHSRGEDGYCAVGIILKELGLDEDLMEEQGAGGAKAVYMLEQASLMRRTNYAVSSDSPVFELVARNNAGQTFTQLADWLESLGL